MKISFSRDYGTVKVNFDEKNYEQDAQKCRQLEKLFVSEEWVTLLELLTQAEEKLDEAVMKVKPSEQSFRENAIYSARKNGFCEAMGLLRKAVESYREFKVKRKKEMEEQVDSMLGRQEEEMMINE